MLVGSEGVLELFPEDEGVGQGEVRDRQVGIGADGLAEVRERLQEVALEQPDQSLQGQGKRGLGCG